MKKEKERNKMGARMIKEPIRAEEMSSYIERRKKEEEEKKENERKKRCKSIMEERFEEDYYKYVQTEDASSILYKYAECRKEVEELGYRYEEQMACNMCEKKECEGCTRRMREGRRILFVKISHLKEEEQKKE
jgi:hypothetical protein